MERGIKNKQIVPKTNPINKPIQKPKTSVTSKTIVKKPVAQTKNQTQGLIPKQNPKKPIGYKYVGGESFAQMIRKSIPKEMIPTNLTGKILGFVFLAVVIISLFQFPIGQFLKGDISVSIKVGLPRVFLEFSLSDPSKNPIKIWNLALDLFFYILIAYTIEVIINIVKGTSLFTSNKDLRKLPKTFKNRKETIAEKVTKEVFKKEVKPKPATKNPSQKTIVKKATPIRRPTPSMKKV